MAVSHSRRVTGIIVTSAALLYSGPMTAQSLGGDGGLGFQPGIPTGERLFEFLERSQPDSIRPDVERPGDDGSRSTIITPETINRARPLVGEATELVNTLEDGGAEVELPGRVFDQRAEIDALFAQPNERLVDGLSALGLEEDPALVWTKPFVDYYEDVIAGFDTSRYSYWVNRPEAPEVKVSPNAPAKPQVFAGGLESENAEVAPTWIATNTIFLKLHPTLEASEIKKLLREYKLVLKETFPELGTLSALADLRGVYSEDMSTSEWLSATADLMREYTEDPRILAATPEFGVDAPNNWEPDKLGLSTLDQAYVFDEPPSGTTVDWGIGDIGADKVWPYMQLPVQRIVAVFDTGFALHEDIPFVDAIDGERVKSHGNHVAAILCGLHNDKGFKGVLPYCGVRAKDLGVLDITPTSKPEHKKFRLMQGVVEAFWDFVREVDDVAAYNVSLGYNWHKLKESDPTFEFVDNPDLQFVIEMQASWVYQSLELANRRNVPIVSAAGNDSGGLEIPFSSRWASPFNYAALTACETRGICNGIVVEAHDSEGKRAVFSNSGGHLSCPGVNIESALAKKSLETRIDAYGVRSGTSMAAPYCTGGLVILGSLMPRKSVAEILDCARASGVISSGNVPMLRLEAALAACGVTDSVLNSDNN